MKRFAAAVTPLLLAAATAACSGGGGDGDSSSVSCDSITGIIMSGPSGGPCAGCSVENGRAAADADMYTFATMTTANAGVQQIKVRSAAQTYPPGYSPGAFMTAEATTDRVLSINTYMGESPVESASGPALIRESTRGGTGASEYVSFRATLPFDAVEVLATSTGTSTTVDYVFEICSTGRVN